MFIEQRTYALHTGAKLTDFLEAYETIGLPVQKRVLGGFLGYFTSDIGTLNQVMHLWAYVSLDERDRLRTELHTEPEWLRCLDIIRPMISTMENTIFKPTSSPARAAASALPSSPTSSTRAS